MKKIYLLAIILELLFISLSVQDLRAATIMLPSIQLEMGAVTATRTE